MTDDTAATGPTDARGDARLGVFHPLAAERVTELLFRKGVTYTVVTRDDDVELRVDAVWRDDLRTELSLSWEETVLARLEPEDAAVLVDTGTDVAGWFDAPRGGHIDRAGRLVVDADADQEEARIIGPALCSAGLIAAVLGWWVIDSTGIAMTGLAVAIVGLFTPR